MGKTFAQKATENKKDIQGLAFRNQEKLILDFCDFFSLPESKEKLWSMLKAYLGSELSDHLDNQQRYDYLIFYEKLKLFLDSCFLKNSK